MAARRLSPWRAAAIAAALCLPLGAVAAWALRGEPQRPIVMEAVQGAVFVVPGSHLFGDPVEANLELVVDRRVVDPRTVRVKTDFAPYGPVGAPRISRRDAGRTVSLRYRYRLLCLAEACRPESERARDFTFSEARVSFRRAGKRETIGLEWPAIEAASRLTAAALQTVAPLVREHPLPPVSYRIAPGPAFALLLAAAALAGLGGFVLLWPAVRMLAGVPRRDELDRLPPLERALALLKRARGAPVEERKALDLLARELGGRNEQLARGARRLAWSETDPPSDEVAALAGQVEAAVGRRR